jgi:hypothetical protein
MRDVVVPDLTALGSNIPSTSRQTFAIGVRQAGCGEEGAGASYWSCQVRAAQ